MQGLLIAFEGLDQSGKQTQAESLRDYFVAKGRDCRLVAFPDYTTPIGMEISRALHGEREYAADTLQLLYIANRYEHRGSIQSMIEAGVAIVCDRYAASSIAYGEAQGLDPGWLADVQRFLPAPDLTIVLDIAPETAVQRKAVGRDRYERDLALLSRVRDSYYRQSRQHNWIRLDGERDRADVTADVLTAVATRLAQP
jgi:dTMP kinase